MPSQGDHHNGDRSDLAQVLTPVEQVRNGLNPCLNIAGILKSSRLPVTASRVTTRRCTLLAGSCTATCMAEQPVHKPPEMRFC